MTMHHTNGADGSRPIVTGVGAGVKSSPSKSGSSSKSGSGKSDSSKSSSDKGSKK